MFKSLTEEFLLGCCRSSGVCSILKQIYLPRLIMGQTQAGTWSPCLYVLSTTALSWRDRCESLGRLEGAGCCRGPGCYGHRCPWCPSSPIPPEKKQEAVVLFRLFTSRFGFYEWKETCRPGSNAFSSAETGIHQSHLKRDSYCFILRHNSSSGFRAGSTYLCRWLHPGILLCLQSRGICQVHTHPGLRLWAL